MRSDGLNTHSLAVLLLSEFPENTLKLVNFLLLFHEHEVLVLDGLISSCENSSSLFELNVRLIELLLETVCLLLLLLKPSAQTLELVGLVLKLFFNIPHLNFFVI